MREGGHEIASPSVGLGNFREVCYGGTPQGVGKPRHGPGKVGASAGKSRHGPGRVGTGPGKVVARPCESTLVFGGWNLEKRG
jgi:hypothetical protein